MGASLFITFEGIDGSGKSTQCRLLHERLMAAQIPVQLFREPGGTHISEKIRDILLDRENHQMAPITEMLLYFASRQQLIREKIEPALAAGEVVLLDRFVDSTIAYQGYGRDLSLDHIQAVAKVAIGTLKPDLTILVDTPLDTAADRMDNRELDRLEAETQAFKERTRNGYLKLAKEEAHRFLVLDGNQPIQALQEQVWQRVQSLLEDD